MHKVCDQEINFSGLVHLLGYHRPAMSAAISGGSSYLLRNSFQIVQRVVARASFYTQKRRFMYISLLKSNEFYSSYPLESLMPDWSGKLRSLIGLYSVYELSHDLCFWHYHEQVENVRLYFNKIGRVLCCISWTWQMTKGETKTLSSPVECGLVQIPKASVA